MFKEWNAETIFMLIVIGFVLFAITFEIILWIKHLKLTNEFTTKLIDESIAELNLNDFNWKEMKIKQQFLKEMKCYIEFPNRLQVFKTHLWAESEYYLPDIHSVVKFFYEQAN